MYDSELTEITKLVAAMVDADVNQVMEIHMLPGSLEVTVRQNWMDGEKPVKVTHEIPWTFDHKRENG